MKKIAIALLGVLWMAGSALADILLPYTPETYLDKAKDIQVRLINLTADCTVIKTGQVESFFALHKRGDSEVTRIDLKERLKEIPWKNPTGTVASYAAILSKDELQKLGDYVLCIIPACTLYKEEDCYIQQITKLIVNRGGIPGNWDEPASLPCEILPLSKPYGLWTGNVFHGQVLSEGKPVPHAEVEVEYLSHIPNLRGNTMNRKGNTVFPNIVLKTQTIVTDSRGYFAYGIPKAGWWGFAALGIGPQKKHEEKDLFQDAVIWVQALDMR